MPPAKRRTARKTAAKKTTARKPAKRRTVKKAAAKKTTARKPAKRRTVKKAAAKKTTKRAPAKRRTAKKAASEEGCGEAHGEEGHAQARSEEGCNHARSQEDHAEEGREEGGGEAHGRRRPRASGPRRRLRPSGHPRSVGPRRRRPRRRPRSVGPRRRRPSGASVAPPSAASQHHQRSFEGALRGPFVAFPAPVRLRRLTPCSNSPSQTPRGARRRIRLRVTQRSVMSLNASPPAASISLATRASKAALWSCSSGEPASMPMVESHWLWWQRRASILASMSSSRRPVRRGRRLGLRRGGGSRGGGGCPPRGRSGGRGRRRCRRSTSSPARRWSGCRRYCFHGS